MIIYNITYSIDPEIETEWLEWMKEIFLEKIKSTNLVCGLKILKLLTEIESEGINYSFQLEFDRTEHLATFEELYQQVLEGEHHKQFEGKYVSFRTLLKEVHTVF